MEDNVAGSSYISKYILLMDKKLFTSFLQVKENKGSNYFQIVYAMYLTTSLLCFRLCTWSALCVSSPFCNNVLVLGLGLIIFINNLGFKLGILYK